MSKYHIFLKHNTKVTTDNLKLLYQELILMKNNSYIEKQEEQCKEVIQYIIEYLIYGDQHDPNIFDLFCEYNFMNEFIYLSNMNNRTMNLQIIKSFSILILNMTNTTTLYYIFSNNFINQIISHDYEKYDDEFVSYYVNFIKSLSLKIDTTTVQFFFHKQMNSFPLLQSALKMYNHTDPMIKNVVRNVILTIMKIKYEPIIDFFSCLPCITYFPFLACRIRDLIIKLNEEIVSDDQISLKNIHDDIIDDILYIQDIFSLKIEKINYILTNSLFYYMVLPLLCGSLVSMTKPIIAISISLYVTLSLFHYIKNEHFLNLLFAVMFCEKLKKKLVNYMEGYPKNIKNYFFDWNAQKKYHYNSFTNYISANFSEPFIKSLIYQINPSYSEIHSIIKKHDKLADELDLNSAEYLKTMIEEVLSKFSNSEFDIMTSYHKNISIATGVNVGLAMPDSKKKSVTKIAERMFNKMKEGHNEKTFLQNGCREILYIYLKSKDDTLVLLMSLLIFTIHKKGISKELLSICKLLKACDMSDSEFDTNLILNEIFGTIFGDNMVEPDPRLGIATGILSFNQITNINVNMIENKIDNEWVEAEESPNIENTEISLTKMNEKLIIDSVLNLNNNDPKAEKIADLNGETTNINIIPDEMMTNLNKSNINRISSYLDHSDETLHNNINSISDIVSVFTNTYFKDLPLKNFEAKQKMYDVELIDSFLNLLMVEPSFRTITNRMILENIKSLIIKTKKISYLERSQLDIINKIYYTYLSNIKLIILNNKYIRDTGFEVFEQEWKNYTTDLKETLDELISKPYLLIPFNLEDTIEDYPKNLRIQKNDLDNFKSNLVNFMTLHDLRCAIYMTQDYVCNTFPLKLGGFELDLEQSYNLTNIGIDVYHCKLKNNTIKNFMNFYMMIYQNHLYFALPDSNDPQFAVVKYKYALRHLEAHIDRSDPRIINLVVKVKKEYFDIFLNFEDVAKTMGVKKILEENRKSAKNTEYLLLDSYFDDLTSKFKF